MVDPNIRQGKRTPVTLKIKFKSETLEQFIERYAVDVSQGGIFIRTKDPLAVGTQMRFEFQLRDASPLIGGEGTVVWTRENDPSRPAIAPGMGVRFDRLAEGSQSVLERILAEKLKQAPQRNATETSKPPMFTDTPTRVAPGPVQDALLNDKPRNRDDSFSEQTPLPKPTPWHSDADEFPEEAFEEATKVRSLDDLVAQGAIDAADTGASDELAARRAAPRVDSTIEDAAERAPTAVVHAPAANERDSAPVLPSPPESAARPQPRMLDTTPSPRTEATTSSPSTTSPPPMESAKPKVAAETVRTKGPSDPAFVAKDAPTRPSGMRAVASDTGGSLRLPSAASTSKAPLVIVLLVLLAAAGGAVWFFVLRKPVQEAVTSGEDPGSAGSAAVDSRGAAGSGGSATVASGSATTTSGSDGSNAGTMVGSNGSDTAPKAELVETVITASSDKATIEVGGQTGPSPLKAKLEKGKAYTAHITAPGFAPLELEVTGGAEKLAAKLTAKPRLISVTTDPPGALIFVDGSATGHSTPFEVELTKAQSAKKSIRVMVRKSGFRSVEKVVGLDAFTEDATQMVYPFSEHLTVQAPASTNSNAEPPVKNTGSAGSGNATPGSAAATGSGTTTGSASTGTSGSASTGTGSASPTPGSAAEATKPATGAATPTTPPVKDTPKPGNPEPEPDFSKSP